MWFLFKLFLTGIALTAGAFLVVDRTPSLKASIVEVVNPRVRETRLLGDLREHLDTATTLLTQEEGEVRQEGEEHEDGSASDDSTRRARVEQALRDAREVLDDVVMLNEEESGAARQVVTKTLTTVLADTPSPVSEEPAPTSSQAEQETPTPDPCEP